jgi:hypothetical protein
LSFDCETGFIKMLGQWAVDDCGRIVVRLGALTLHRELLGSQLVQKHAFGEAG